MKIVLILAFCMVAAGSAVAIDPVLSGGGGGDKPLELDPDRHVCWSQGPNLDGLIGSSEQILAFGLESELANDFLATGGSCVGNARWWGGYYNYLLGDPLVPTFNLRFYEDAGCVPGPVLCEYIIDSNANETFVYDQFGFPVYEYNWDVSCQVTPDNLYWFGAQAGDHPFPPQWGRLEAAGGVQLCDTVFKSAYFGYPDWVPAVDVFSVSFDASQEFVCDEGPGCVVIPPPDTGACCIGDQGECRIMGEGQCEYENGQFQGWFTTCEPVNPCIPIATVPNTWGSI
jgi:hypothetical protein